MIDINLNVNELGEIDIDKKNGVVSIEDTLKTSVIVSLFTDARVDGQNGFFGDSFSDASWGSKIWTLKREKLTPVTQKKVEEYAKESLQWLINDKIASKIEITSEIVLPMSIRIHVKIIRPSGSVSGYRFDNIWGE